MNTYKAMEMSPTEIETLLQQLPEHLRAEVMDHIQFLLSQSSSGTQQGAGSFGFKWEGGLSKLKNKYTSVELQHKALEWR